MFDITLFRLCVTILSLLQLTSAYTNYEYYAHQGGHFNHDCQVAAASLVLRQTGLDNFGWFPAGTIIYEYGTFRAVISASGNRL